VILTKDEETNVPRAISSLPSGCVVLVVDAQSKDGTARVARDCGAQVIVREWRGFVDARVFALGLVKTPWTLMLDADEILDGTLREAVIAADGSADGYQVSRTTYFEGRPMRIWSHERILRLFRTELATLRSAAMSARAEVHEMWSVPGRVADLPGELSHHSYPTAASYRAKFERYTDLEAERLRKTRSEVYGAQAAAALRFLYLLFVKGSILDGRAGVFVAWWSAWYRAAVFQKALRGE